MAHSLALSNKVLNISYAKSTTTLFTPCNYKVNFHPKLKILNIHLVEQNPKILGVTFNGSLTFAAYASCTATITFSGLYVAQSGVSKNVHYNDIHRHPAIRQYISQYATLIWLPTTAPLDFPNLLHAQNITLRIVTECQIMPAHNHLQQQNISSNHQTQCWLLADEFFVSCYNLQHLSFTTQHSLLYIRGIKHWSCM